MIFIADIKPNIEKKFKSEIILNKPSFDLKFSFYVRFVSGIIIIIQTKQKNILCFIKNYKREYYSDLLELCI